MCTDLSYLKKVADIIAPKLSIIFRKLIGLGSFPECWRSANRSQTRSAVRSVGGAPLGMAVTAIPKGAPSPDRENYRPISIKPILSKVYEKLVPHKLTSFCEKYGLLSAA